MPVAIQFGLKSWSLPVPSTVALVFVAVLYLCGWFRFRRISPGVIPLWRAAAFLCGLFLVWIAVGSPLAELDEELLSVHMVQHLLLMTLASPLILLAAPAMVFLHAFPLTLPRGLLGPVLRSPAVQRLGRVIAAPLFCWLVATAVLMGWHFPAAYKLGLESHKWHELQHGSFLVAGLFFWWPVIPPWPSVVPRARWSVVLYLFLATLPCDALSAFLTFSGRVVYTSYLDMPRHFSISPLQDQEFAGALMWICVTFAYLIPAVFLTARLLSTPRAESSACIHAQTWPE